MPVTGFHDSILASPAWGHVGDVPGWGFHVRWFCYLGMNGHAKQCDVKNRFLTTS